MSMHNSGRNDTKNPGGSIGFDRLKTVYTPANVPDSEQTLGDYIARKQRAAALDAVRKDTTLTFEEWYSQSSWAARNKMLMLDPESLKRIMQSVWKAAQENA